MKYWCGVVLSLSLLSLADAEVSYVREDFNGLSLGALVGQGGGMGFAEHSEWQGGQGFHLMDGDLSARPPEGERYVRSQHGEARHLASGHTSWEIAQRALAAPLRGEVWFRFLINAAADSAAGISFDPDYGQPAVWVDGRDLVVQRSDRKDEVRINGIIDLNQTTLVLGRLASDEVSIWIDPDVTDRGNPALVVAGIDWAGRDQLSHLVLHGRGAALDEVIISTHADPAGFFHVAPRLRFHGPWHTPSGISDEVTPLPPPGYELVWYDEFEGDALDADKWTYRGGSKADSTQLAENIEVKNGQLIIHARKQQTPYREYTGGGVIAKDAFIYGYYESRFKVPEGEGWHTSFWTFPVWADDLKGSEIDFCEQDSGDPHLYSFGVIDQEARGWVNRNVARWTFDDAPNMAQEFVVIGAEFTPEVIRFYMNGRLKQELPSAAFPQGPAKVRLSCIATRKKGDRFQDDARLPSQAVFDYVRLYQHPRYAEAEAAVRAAPTQRTIWPDRERDLPDTDRMESPLD